MTPREAHLPPPGTPVLRFNAYGQAYRLTEAPPPGGGVIELVRWLDVEHGARWRPRPGTTYCNVYAHDVCNLLGAYLPRVWWAAVAAPDAVPVLGKTVFELSANALYGWLDARSEDFGWRCLLGDVDAAQRRANDGAVVVFCARNKEPAHSGHISVVVPEDEVRHALRDGYDPARVLIPVQSQAGGTNYVASTRMGAWWLSKTFDAWGAWAWERTEERVPFTPEGPAQPLGRADRAERGE